MIGNQQMTENELKWLLKEFFGMSMTCKSEINHCWLLQCLLIVSLKTTLGSWKRRNLQFQLLKRSILHAWVTCNHKRPLFPTFWVPLEVPQMSNPYHETHDLSVDGKFIFFHLSTIMEHMDSNHLESLWNKLNLSQVVELFKCSLWNLRDCRINNQMTNIAWSFWSRLSRSTASPSSSD